ncbi:MAG: hypothetical protein ACYTDW_20900 [Planctomycetota bacterium]|jgi:hypothetical protein
MAKKLALILAILMIVFLGGWSLLGLTTDVSVSINGREITGPLGAAVGLWGIILTFVLRYF